MYFSDLVPQEQSEWWFYKKNVIDEIISILFEILKVLNLSIDIPCAPSKAANTSFELT